MSCLFDSVKKMNWFSDCFLLTLVLQPNAWMSRTLAIFMCLIYERSERKEKHQTCNTAISSSDLYGPALSHLPSSTRTDRKTIKDELDTKHVATRYLYLCCGVNIQWYFLGKCLTP